MIKLSPLTVSQNEYTLILEQIESLSNRIPTQLVKAKKLNIVGDASIKIEGDDLWEPVPWTARWEEDLECWYGWRKKNGTLGVSCHKKINKRLALTVSSLFSPTLYTKNSEGVWGLEDLKIK